MTSDRSQLRCAAASPLVRSLVAGVAGLIVSIADTSARDLAPGQTATVFDPSINFRDPGTSVAGDPTLNGEIVAFLSRPLSMTVTDYFWVVPPQAHTFAAVLDDWVVRRLDTGTLDFYVQLRLDPLSSFGGSITRPVSTDAGQITVGYRNDLPSGVASNLFGTLPSRFSRSADGGLFSSTWVYFDDIGTNPVREVSAPILYRSTALSFGEGSGSISFSATYNPTHYATGQTSFTFFAPVPEPAAFVLMLGGLVVVVLQARRSGPASSVSCAA